MKRKASLKIRNVFVNGFKALFHSAVKRLTICDEKKKKKTKTKIKPPKQNKYFHQEIKEGLYGYQFNNTMDAMQNCMMLMHFYDKATRLKRKRPNR